jgi:hypothetical protein
MKSSEHYDELGKAVMKFRHWRWMPGMSYIDLKSRTRGYVTDEFYYEGGNYNKNYIPDLLDPATLGWVRLLASQAWGGVEISIGSESELLNEDSNQWNRLVRWTVIDEQGCRIGNARGSVEIEEGKRIVTEAIFDALKSASDNDTPETF